MKTFRTALVIVFACSALAGRGLCTDVLTYHNDNARTGWNSQEATLTPHNVNAQSFGLIRNLPVDGAVFAQPLYVSNAQVFSAGQSQGVHNLVIVVTEHDSVYAFDADSGSLYWRVSMLGSGEIPSDGLGCADLPTENGITSTPVIDRASGPHGTIFLLAMSKTPDNANYYERLHAVDLGTGQDKQSPVTIQASYPGRGPGNDGKGNVIFGATHQRGRAGLLLTNGTLYTSWASFCDFPDGSLLTTSRHSPERWFLIRIRMARRLLTISLTVLDQASGRPDNHQLSTRQAISMFLPATAHLILILIATAFRSAKITETLY
jgi:hypothetical protein